MAHVHEVIDHDNHFIIDPITRKINPETPEKNELVQYDHNSERLTFEIPRYVDGHDMSLCTSIQIHYINVSGDNKQNNSDIYEVDDVGPMSDDETVVSFTWLISQNATQFVGTLNFAIRFVCATEEIVDYVWNTKVYSSIHISNGLNNEDVVIADNSDILEQWRVALFNGDSADIESMRKLTADVNALEQLVSESNLNSTIQYSFSVADPSAGTNVDVELTSDELLEIATTKETLKELRGPNTAIIAFATDLHIRCGRNADDSEYILSAESATKIKKMIAAYNKIAAEISPDMLIFGGDYLDNNSTTTGDGAKCSLSVLRDLIGFCADVAPISVLKGNHDDNSMNTDYINNWINQRTMWDLILDLDERKTIRDAGHVDKSYGYYDIRNCKIRIFYLNTVDLPQVLDEEANSLNYRAQWSSGFSKEQLQFVADNLQFNERGWHVIFFSHHPLLYNIGIEAGCGVNGPYGGDAMLSIISAFAKNQAGQSEVSAIDFQCTIAYDFSKNVDCRVIACVNGHTHRDDVTTYDGISIISTRAVFGHPSYEGHISSFCYFVIDRVNYTLDMVYNGDGTDEIFVYGSDEDPNKPITFDFGWTIGEVNNTTGSPIADTQNMRTTNTNLFGYPKDTIIHFNNVAQFPYDVYWYNADGGFLADESNPHSWRTESTLVVPKDRLLRLKIRSKNYGILDDNAIAAIDSSISITLA